jgi:2-polyprenyl-3-methyl-5-hydroxy-6-metoxy-1,4-benzoquinol methylase
MFTSFAKWKFRSQVGELKFHQSSRWRKSPVNVWESENRKEVSHLLNRDLSSERLTIIDIGSGSRLRFSFAKNARIIAVEPLAKEFIATVPWCDLEQAHEFYALPAERKIRELEERGDLVASLNVIDHVYSWEKVVGNMCYYLATDGELLISFDSHQKLDALHPVKIQKEEVVKFCVSHGMRLISSEERAPYHPGLNGIRHDLRFVRASEGRNDSQTPNLA